MAQGAKSSSHVPKFGNWDTDDVPYTICFENARELRAAGITFDPNDPDSYPPQATAQAVSADRHYQAAGYDGVDHQQHRKRRPREQPSLERRAIGNSGSEKLSSERSGSDYALLREPKQNGRRRSNNRLEGGISRFSPTVAGHGGKPNPRVRRNNEEEMIASVPKFGSWDARNPKSGDGYTEIFNKVKIEKQIGGSDHQAVPPLANQNKQPIAHTTTPTTHGSTSFASKICCCFCPN